MSIEVTLSPDQETSFLDKYIPLWRDQIGESTDRADQQLAEKWAIAAYVANAKQNTNEHVTAPKEFVWCASPLSMGAAIYVYNVLDGTESYRPAPAFENTFPGATEETRRVINDYFKRRHPTVEAAYEARKERIPDLDEFISAAVYRAAAQVNSGTFHGSMDADWLCFYDFLNVEFHDDVKDQIDPQIAQAQIARLAGWWIPFDIACFVSERPTVIARDDQRRFHSDDGPAIGYADGFGYYAWHGMNVPGQYIEQREHITIELVFAETNMELRRALVEIWGEDNFLRALNVEPIHRDEFGALYVFSLQKDADNAALRERVLTGEYNEERGQDALEIVFAVRVLDPSTDRVYMLQVPAQDGGGNPMVRAKQAVAWTFNMTEAEYMPLQQA